MYANVRETSSSSSCLDLWRARIAQRYSLMICASLSSAEAMVSDRDCIFFSLDSIWAWASAREPVVGGSGRCILTLLGIGQARDVGGRCGWKGRRGGERGGSEAVDFKSRPHTILHDNGPGAAYLAFVL